MSNEETTLDLVRRISRDEFDVKIDDQVWTKYDELISQAPMMRNETDNQRNKLKNIFSGFWMMYQNKEFTKSHFCKMMDKYGIPCGDDMVENIFYYSLALRIDEESKFGLLRRRYHNYRLE